MTYGTAKLQIALDELQKAGSEGTTSRQIGLRLGLSPKQTSWYLNQWGHMGHAYRAGHQATARWFAQKADADAYAHQMMVRSKEGRKAALKRRADKLRAIRAGLETGRLVQWTHYDKWQCAPGEQPYGAGFAALGVGRYL